ncbi:hypothetical protein SBX64_01530 [Vibrio rhizosphaerae]|uniref:Uncharacterized protein n=1 Tax=Vibrio rhizosphaerae TaxID=398736 RepID=A0ABU4ISR4_9VIBR|nr:hypothetical protein [Vibrio rhizosphaerae]MDW6091248.1 hypothetical protein [Vibrio rhizosphaerae]
MSYQPTAYNSRQFNPQPQPKKSRGLMAKIRKRGQVFPFSDANTSIATTALKEQSPSILNEEDAENDLFWTHKKVQPYTFVAWAGFYLFMVMMVKVVLYIIYPLACVLMLIPAFGEAGPGVALQGVWTFTLYAALPAVIIYLPVFIINRINPNINKDQLERWVARKKYCLSRETGMVTLYGAGNRKIFTHPFIEFDCILASNPNHQGLLSYRLMLVHRYSNYKYGVNIGSLVGVNAPVAEYHRLWNMIQQYMDVSKPLPDVPMLEQFRKLDPTTAAYDQQHQRNPNYWRSMSDEEFDKTLTEMARNQREQNIPPTGREIDIFAKAA